MTYFRVGYNKQLFPEQVFFFPQSCAQRFQEEFSHRKRVNTIRKEWVINQKLLMNDGGSKV